MKQPGGLPSFRRIVGAILGTLLLVAAILKISSGDGFFLVQWDRVAIPSMEILLALWLLSGVRLAWSLSAATALFVIFTLLTLWKVAHGVADCGCFGNWSPSPKVTYWIDVAMLTAAIAALHPRQRIILLPVILLASGLLYSGALYLRRISTPAATMVVGHSWPPPGMVDSQEDLSKGRWIVLIHGSECARCRDLADEYARDADHWASLGRRTRLALLDVDRADDQVVPAASSTVVKGTILHDDIYRHAPILLLLDEGKILAMEEGWQAVDWSDSTHSSWIR